MWGFWQAYLVRKSEDEEIERQETKKLIIGLELKFLEACEFANNTLSMFRDGFIGCPIDFLIQQEEKIGRKQLEIEGYNRQYKALVGLDEIDSNYEAAWQHLEILLKSIGHAYTANVELKK